MAAGFERGGMVLVLVLVLGFKKNQTTYRPPQNGEIRPYTIDKLWASREEHPHITNGQTGDQIDGAAVGLRAVLCII